MRYLRLLTAALPLMLAACHSDSMTAVPIEQTTFASSLGVNLQASTKTASGLYYRDITVGTGTTLAAGQSVDMRYTGSFANGSVFDSNADASKPVFNFRLGAGQVIKGWDEGLVGMKVGGKRQLVIPPSLGYGANDYGPIPGNSVLVFTVEALSAR